MSPSHSGSPLPHILLPAVQILALTLPPSKYRAPIFASTILFLAYTIYTTNLPTSKPETILLLINQWPTFLGTVEKLLFSAPEHDFWRLDRSPHEAAALPFGWQKARWAAALLVNPRGIGWSCQVKGVPRATVTRDAIPWLRTQVLRYAKFYVVTDAVHVYLSRCYYGDGADLANLTVRAETWSRSFVNALMAGFKIYFPLQLIYTLGSIVFVLLHLSKPKDWPPLFGRVKDVTTVRHFWGSFWHQAMRKMFTGYSQALVRLLGIPRGTNLSSYLQLYTSFAISGFFHALMTSVMPASAQHAFQDRFMLAFNFFMLQAIGIHLEDIVIASYEYMLKEANASGEGKQASREVVGVNWKTLVGYVWVVCWFWFSLGWGGDAYLRAGIANVNDVPYPFMGRLVSHLGL